jgi:hypothetical protein
MEKMVSAARIIGGAIVILAGVILWANVISHASPANIASVMTGIIGWLTGAFLIFYGLIMIRKTYRH